MNNNQGLHISRQNLGLNISDSVTRFEAIQETVAAGGDINRTDARGYTYLTDWIERLYMEVADQIENDDGDRDSAVHPWYKASLEERGLLPMLNWFFDAGLDPNGDQMIPWPDHPEDAGTDSALMFTVGKLDYPLTEYLLQHGVDPNKRVDIDERPGHHAEDPECYYMDDLDIELESASGERAQLCVDMAKLLLQYGQIYRGGSCIEMSEDGREILSVHRMIMKH